MAAHDEGSWREYRLLFLDKFRAIETALDGIRAEQSEAHDERYKTLNAIDNLRRDMSELKKAIEKKTGPLPPPPIAGDGSQKSRGEIILEEVKGRWQIYLILATLLANLIQTFFKP